MDIKIDDLTNPDVRALVQTHRNEMAGRDNADISHALGLDAVSYTHLTLPTIYSV